MTWHAMLLSVVLVGGADVRQLQVRFDGYLGATRQEAGAFQELQVRVGEGALQPFALTNVMSLMGGGPVGTDIVDQMLPIKPNFIFTGDAKLIERIASAKPNQLLRITGWTQWGSQYVLVETVEESEPVTGPTPTPNLRKKLLGF
ncbi:MAG: hypothetical protein FJ148_25735 [Deltaproteobacteria bacterium]|nr:hypothetical protein [Deltaproteobacteria bacterium]